MSPEPSKPGKADLSALVGRSLGSYRILKLLGAGGMGAVFLGEHKAIGHKAAIKILHPEVARDEETAQRFFNEARAVNLVKHSSIVQIFDYGQEPEIGAYLVMEFLEGQSLGERLREGGPFAPRDAVRILGRVASALGAAHKGGLIHRDLKPDNVFLLREEDDAGAQRVKVVDFGIAKLGDHKTSGVKTATGLIVGTPAYMAPEYIHGNKAFDHRIDVYSLGIIAYEMICGRPPFVGDGLGEMLVAHMVTPPPPLSQFRPDVPPPVEAVIMRALAKDPTERYASMEELAQALLVAVGEVPSKSPSTRNSMATGLRSVFGASSEEVGLAATVAPTPVPSALGSAATEARGLTGAAPRAALASAPTALFDSGSKIAATGTVPRAEGGGRTGPPSTITASAAEIRRDAVLDAMPGRRGGGARILAFVGAGVLVAAGTVAVLLIAGGEDPGPDESASAGDEAESDEETEKVDRKPGDAAEASAVPATSAIAATAGAPGTSAGAEGATTAAAGRTVRHRIESSVEGATVVCLADGAEGRVPWTHDHEVKKGKGKIRYEVRAPDYKPAKVVLSAKEDGTATVALLPLKAGAGSGSTKRPDEAAPRTAATASRTVTSAPRTAGSPAGPKTERPLAEE